MAMCGVALACAAGMASAAELVVDIENITTQRGRLAVFLYDSAAGWDAQNTPLARQRVEPDGSDRLRVRFDDLAPGRYAVMVLHDTDGNGKFDVGLLGIPKDDYGFSNNPIVFRKPDFPKVAFDVPATGARIAVRLK